MFEHCAEYDGTRVLSIVAGRGRQTPEQPRQTSVALCCDGDVLGDRKIVRCGSPQQLHTNPALSRWLPGPPPDLPRSTRKGSASKLPPLRLVG